MAADTHYFQKVYEITALVPKGRVTTYGAIADYLALGSARMVGWALNKCGHHPDSIPAHRVVNRKGELSGRLQFPTPTTMEERLEADGVKIINNKVMDFEQLFWHPATLQSEVDLPKRKLKH